MGAKKGGPAMTNSHRFFNNHQCKYFPCHLEVGQKEFNCLFCYCPLYPLGDQCGGVFTFTEKGVKNCMGCHLPHEPAFYDALVEQLMGK